MQKQASQFNINVNDKIEKLSEKIDKVKEDAKEKDNSNAVKMSGIIERLDSIERRMNDKKDKKDKSEENEEEKRKQRVCTKIFKDAVGLSEDAHVDAGPKSKSWSEIVEESKQKDDEKKEKEKERKMKHWTKKVTVRTRKEKISPDEEEKEEEKKKEEVKRLVEKEEERGELRLDSPHHSEDDWSWDGSDLDWDGTVEKDELMKKKKIERYKKKKLLENKVAKKAKHMLGLGPIRRASVSYFNNIVGDLEDAKKMAIDEFLSGVSPVGGR